MTPSKCNRRPPPSAPPDRPGAGSDPTSPRSSGPGISAPGFSSPSCGLSRSESWATWPAMRRVRRGPCAEPGVGCPVQPPCRRSLVRHGRARARRLLAGHLRGADLPARRRRRRLRQPGHRRVVGRRRRLLRRPRGQPPDADRGRPVFAAVADIRDRPPDHVRRVARESPFVQQSPWMAKQFRLLLLFVGLGAVSWLNMARIVRGQVLSLRTRPFVEASRPSGPARCGSWAATSSPMCLAWWSFTSPSRSRPLCCTNRSSAFWAGHPAAHGELGPLLAEGVNQINPIRIYWWLIAFPGGVLVSTLLALNFVGDGLRDAWDVKGRT